MQHLKVSKLNPTSVEMWKRPAGVELRNKIKLIRDDYIQAMYRASTKEQVASASLLMLQRIDMWINQLIEYTRTCPGYNRKDRRQAELTCKHMSSNLSYTTILDRFAKEPSMPTVTLVEVRKALKELYPLKNIDPSGK